MKHLSALSIYHFIDSYRKDPQRVTVETGSVFVGRTRDSLLIGPAVDENFDAESFFRRIRSTCIYTPKIYRSLSRHMLRNLLCAHEEEWNALPKDGMTVLEICDDGRRVIHSVIPLPGREKKQAESTDC